MYIMGFSLIECIIICIESIFIRRYFSKSIVRIIILLIISAISYLFIFIISYAIYKENIKTTKHRNDNK